MEAMCREASSRDREAVYTLLCQATENALEHDNFVRVYESALRSEHDVLLVAEAEEGIIGFASLHIQHVLHQAGSLAQISELFVSPAYRDEGTGSGLVEYLKSIAHECGCPRICIAVLRSGQRQAYGFFEEHGFEKTHATFTFTMEENG